MLQRFLLVLAVAACCASSWAYVKRIAPQGATVRRSDFTNIQFEVNEQFAAGAMNADGVVVIAPTADPFQAIQGALDEWNGIVDSAIFFTPAQPTAIPNSGSDRRHTIGIPDTPDSRSLVGGALAVTSFFTVADGTITDSDIYFNPSPSDRGELVRFGTTGDLNEQDIQSTAFHELGHALGLDHTNVQGASMYQSGRKGEIFTRTLADDDRAFAVDQYPADSASMRFGRIAGKAMLTDGQPIRGGMLTAVDPTTGVVVGGRSSIEDGSFEFVVPATNGSEGYLLYVEPLNGPVFPGNVNLLDEQATTDFRTALLGGTATPTRLTVSAGGMTMVDISAEPGPETLEIQLLGAATGGGNIALGDGPREIPPGDSAPIFLWGPGLDQVQPGEIEALGPGFAIAPGSVKVNPAIVVNGFPALEMVVDVALPGGVSQLDPRGALGTLLIRSGGAVATATGALVAESNIEPPRPAFTSQSLVNAASFLGGGIAPGSLVTVFGASLGPTTPAFVGGFDPTTGLVPTVLAGVSASFDGVPAPMVFALDNQLNLQAPFEIAGRAQTTVAITANGQTSDPVVVAVRGAAPGIFQNPTTGEGIILNQDGQVNTSGTPEARGRAVVIFATGQGVTNPALATGAPAPGDPLSGAVGGVTATVGNRPANVLFAGMTPGFVGLMQVNAVIAADAQTGPAVPVSITVAGAMSQPGVTMSVAP